ncbi:hypothetical protein PIB30_066602 [Stylosanthes scabra]|uniref:Putative plant transposon protein domain-containing protein n=1 Tax=Stylosanthes scabra TaxID=79078 RepID=A0ABU6YJX2_9FABA|nr:hypothetical protein [Stylosanthes scabra]
MIPTGNKLEITVARAVLIRSIIKGHDVRIEELIADNIAVLAEGVQGRSKLCFPSTIYRLCKEAGVPMGEFKDSEKIQVAKPITAKIRKCTLKLLELKKIITNTMINLTLRLMSPIFKNTKRTNNKDFSF